MLRGLSHVRVCTHSYVRAAHKRARVCVVCACVRVYARLTSQCGCSACNGGSPPPSPAPPAPDPPG